MDWHTNAQTNPTIPVSLRPFRFSRFHHFLDFLGFLATSMSSAFSPVRWRKVMCVALVALTLTGALTFGSLLVVRTYAASAARSSGPTSAAARSSSSLSALADLPAGCSTRTPVQGNTTNGNGLGETSFYSYIEQGLDNWAHVHVNEANGNFLVHASDVQITGTGLDVSIERFYNSLSTKVSDVGTVWVLSAGADVKLLVNSGAITFVAPSGCRSTRRRR